MEIAWSGWSTVDRNHAGHFQPLMKYGPKNLTAKSLLVCNTDIFSLKISHFIKSRSMIPSYITCNYLVPALAVCSFMC